MQQKPEPPSVKKFLITFVRILVIFALAWSIVYGVKFLMGAL